MTCFSVQNIFGDYSERYGTLLGIVTKGFNTAGGGWSLYGGRPGDTPAEFAIIRWKGKRKHSAVALERLKPLPKPWTDYINQ